MRNQKKTIIIIIVMIFTTHQSQAGWVISSGIKVKVPVGKYLKVDGNLKLLSTAKLTNEGLFTLSGNFDNQGESALGSGTFSFSGSAVQQFTGTAEFGNVSIGSGSSLEIQAGAWATINGTLTNMNGTGGLIVKSDQTGSGSLIHNTASVQGTVQGYLTSEKWHLVSPPISDAELASYLDIYLMDWDEPSATWTYLVDPLTMPLEKGLGFSAWADDNITGNTTVDFAGTLNSADIVLNLDYTLASSQIGWNLIGNPFSSSIDWNTNWTMNDVGGWAVVYDNGVDRGWNPYLPSGSESYNGKTDGIIPMTQGFWVRATAAGAAITIPSSERIHGNQAFYKETSEVAVPTLRLAIEGNNNTDEAVVILMENATSGFDALYDLEKFSSSDVPKLFSIMGESELSVNVLPENFSGSSNPSVDMGFEMPKSGQYKITASGMESFDLETPIYLEDLKEGQSIDLRQQQEYVFASGPLDETNRFILHFSNPLGLSENPDINQIRIYGSTGFVHISMDEPIKGIAKVFDMLGRETGNIRLDGNNKQYSMPVAGKIIYVVKVFGENDMWTKKVYVH
ncbi:MAG: hypothetical protein GXO89_06100 [Chlorobi bacterium]|nr:hypothetical protein [Chlorobiota bacterium]